jgi:hypothetical protein
MPASRRDHAIGAAGASARVKHTRRAVAQRLRDSHKPDPLAPQTPRCITDGLCTPGNHTGAVGCVHRPDGMPCWCGGPHGHDWEGKEHGAPHPR